MLKYIFMIMFLVPSVFFDWISLQSMLILFTLIFITELGCFEFVEGLSLGGGLDLLSYTLVLLSLWIVGMMLLSSEGIISSKFFKNQFLFVLLMLLLFLVLSFYSTNVFLFYLWFESSLIPTFFLILGWGYQSERLQAGVYMLLYTLIFSLPLMIMIFWLFNLSGSVSMFINFGYNKMNLFMFVAVFSAFLVKLPLFMLHLWLPKAHVEAPVSGSMILAGVLLKLGGYGIIRVSMMIYKSIIQFSSSLVILSLVGGVLISLNCLRQSDLKLLIAYSSVSHMGIMLAGVLTFSWWGLSSGLVTMLSHGLCSSGLFFLVNTCYERVGSRSFLFIKGMISFMPKMSLWWFLFCVMNMAAPPSLNLLGEIGLINALVAWGYISMLPLGLMGLFVAAYSLYLFSFSQHGKFSESLLSFSMESTREFLILFLHWVPLNLIIVFSEVSLDWI
uniref:NADH-ubiquinone oxidoreductase chain 4 n=1 Tax=Lachesilla punctata TaxID=2596988 RepID=A0A8K1ZFV7_9NEOP|nr:NADH dehydrogenase subunit 4 [Lachesilla punctata]